MKKSKPQMNRCTLEQRARNTGISLIVILFVVSITAASGMANDKAKPYSTISPIDSLLGDKSELSGKVVYVDFWASWCAPCRASFPWMNRLSKEFEAKGLEVVTVNLDRDHAAAVKFIDELKITMDVVYDSVGSVAKLFEVDAMPTSFVYDRKGVLQERQRGFKPIDTLTMRQTLIDLLNETAERD